MYISITLFFYRLAVGTSWLVKVVHSDDTPVHPSEDLLKLDECGNIHFHFISSAAAVTDTKVKEEKEILSWTGRCVICSLAAMTYQQAHNLIYNQPPDEYSQFISQQQQMNKSNFQKTNNESSFVTTSVPTHIKQVPAGQAGQPIPYEYWKVLQMDLIFLLVFSRFLKRQRAASGSLEIHQASGSELKFKFDPEGALIFIL